ncbi:MAG: hypothetical protein IPG59_05355 [Candidatus Melainabacteria bacterium]|nr:MAG: hypothetical protein IPG59_05355 [Candidatus Melainabacteria bacterium]
MLNKTKSAFCLAFVLAFVLACISFNACYAFFSKKHLHEKQGENYFLACGTNIFKQKNLNADHYPSRSASHLASAWRDVVSSQKICTLDDELATKNEIMSKLGSGWLGQNVQAQDQVFIFLSLPCFPSDHKKEVYLLPYDTEPENLDKSAIKLEQILDSVKKLKAKNTVIFIEGPFAGAVEAIGADDCWFGIYNLIVDKKTESTIEKSKNIVLVLSSKDNQPTTSGAFFQIMSKELANLPEATSLYNVFERVKIKLMDQTKANCKVCKGQVPVLYGKALAKQLSLGPSCLIPSSCE